jgi:hypothetical protein
LPTLSRRRLLRGAYDSLLDSGNWWCPRLEVRVFELALRPKDGQISIKILLQQQLPLIYARAPHSQTYFYLADGGWCNSPSKFCYNSNYFMGRMTSPTRSQACISTLLTGCGAALPPSATNDREGIIHLYLHHRPRPQLEVLRISFASRVYYRHCRPIR